MYAVSMSKTVLFQTIQFSISTQFSFISPIDKTLSGATTPGQSGPGSDGNEQILCIPQHSIITGKSPSNWLVSYPGLSFGEVWPLCKEAVYSTAPANWATFMIRLVILPRNLYLTKVFLVFLLHNEVWFFWQQCSFLHAFSQRSALWASTKCPSHSGLLSSSEDSYLSLWNPYVHKNFGIFINNSSIKNKHARKSYWGCPRGVMVKATDCGIVISEFIFHSCYNVHFRTNTLGKGMNPLILPVMG